MKLIGKLDDEQIVVDIGNMKKSLVAWECSNEQVYDLKSVREWLKHTMEIPDLTINCIKLRDVIHHEITLPDNEISSDFYDRVLKTGADLIWLIGTYKEALVIIKVDVKEYKIFIITKNALEISQAVAICELLDILRIDKNVYHLVSGAVRV